MNQIHFSHFGRSHSEDFFLSIFSKFDRWFQKILEVFKYKNAHGSQVLTDELCLYGWMLKIYKILNLRNSNPKDTIQ